MAYDVHETSKKYFIVMYFLIGFEIIQIRSQFVLIVLVRAFGPHSPY